jgi:hypothetical protein
MDQRFVNERGCAVSEPGTPGQHYIEAEALLAQAYVVDAEHAKYLVACAQVHATLAATMPGAYSDACRWSEMENREREKGQ